MKYGIFLLRQDNNDSYKGLSFQVFKLVNNLDKFNSEEEADAYLRVDKNLPSELTYYILPIESKKINKTQ